MRKENLVLLSAAIVVSLLAAEGLLRLFASPPQYLLQDRMREGIRPASPLSVEVQSAPERGRSGGLYMSTPSGRRLRPNVQGVIRGHFLHGKDIFIRTNSLGFRGPELSDKRPRVLFLGDSITFGDYLPEEQTFVSLVGRLGDWQTINAGVGSVGLSNEYAILREKGAWVRPDAVVVNLYLNDVQPSPVVSLIPVPEILSWSWVAQYSYQAISALRPERDTTISSSEWEAWFREVRLNYPLEGERAEFHSLIHKSFRDWGSAWSPQVIDRLLRVVDEINTETERLGARLFLVIHPVSYQTEMVFISNEPQRAILGGMRERGIVALDLLPTLRGTRGQKLFYDQCHHTPEGSRIVAREIHGFLSSHLEKDLIAGNQGSLGEF